MRCTQTPLFVLPGRATIHTGAGRAPMLDVRHCHPAIAGLRPLRWYQRKPRHLGDGSSRGVEDWRGWASSPGGWLPPQGLGEKPWLCLR